MFNSLTNISVLVMHFISLKGIFTDRDNTRIMSIFFGYVGSNSNCNVHGEKILKIMSITIYNRQTELCI